MPIRRHIFLNREKDLLAKTSENWAFLSIPASLSVEQTMKQKTLQYKGRNLPPFQLKSKRTYPASARNAEHGH